MKYPNNEQAESKTGKQNAFIEAHLNTVYRFCLRLCGGRSADAEDLAQDVLVQAWQHQDGFAGRAKITTWLMRIALNRHQRVRSKSERTQEEPDALEAITTPDSADSTLERLELTRALKELPDNLRTAFLLVKVEGCKYREAAEILGIPVGTVQWQVHEAVGRLRVTLLADAPVSSAESHRSSRSTDSPPVRKENYHAV